MCLSSGPAHTGVLVPVHAGAGDPRYCVHVCARVCVQHSLSVALTRQLVGELYQLFVHLNFSKKLNIILIFYKM